MSGLTAVTSPFFSVVIPVFNRESFIVSTLKSVLCNTFQDFEIIVCDDGSTDNTVCVVESFGERVKLLRQTNQGPAIARNHAIEHAKGCYVAFLDSDDVWFPWTLENYHRAIEKHGFPNLAIGNLIEFRKEEELSLVTQHTWSTEQFDSLLHLIQQRGPMCFYAGTMVIRRDVLTAAGGFEALRMNGEDIDLALRLCTASLALYFPNPPSCGVRRGENSVSDNVDLSEQGIRRIIDKEKKGLYPGGEIGQTSRRALITFMARGVSMRLLASKTKSAAAMFYFLTFPWNLFLRRWKYLLGFPLIWIGSFLRSTFRVAI